MTHLNRLKRPYLEIAINSRIKQVYVLQIAGQSSFLIPIARSASGTSQIGRVTENTEEMVSANLPKS